MQALEAALSHFEAADPALISPPTSNTAKNSLDSASADLLVSPSLDPLCDDRSLWAMDPFWKEPPTLRVQEIKGRTALHLAVRNGNETMTRLLLEQGADATRQDSDGSTALHLAAEYGHDGLAKLLLDQTADPNEIDFLGRTTRFKAVLSGSEKVVKLLLDASLT